MTLQGIRYVLGAISFALAASTMTPLPASADNGVGCNPTPGGGTTCDNIKRYYICPDGTVHLDTGTASACPAPTAYVEKPATAPPPTVAEATPPQNIVCNKPMVATYRVNKWQCIIPTSVRRDANQ